MPGADEARGGANPQSPASPAQNHVAVAAGGGQVESAALFQVAPEEGEGLIEDAGAQPLAVAVGDGLVGWGFGAGRTRRRG